MCTLGKSKCRENERYCCGRTSDLEADTHTHSLNQVVEGLSYGMKTKGGCEPALPRHINYEISDNIGVGISSPKYQYREACVHH